MKGLHRKPEVFYLHGELWLPVVDRTLLEVSVETLTKLKLAVVRRETPTFILFFFSSVQVG